MYHGQVRIVEAITCGVVERAIEVYRAPDTDLAFIESSKNSKNPKKLR